MLNNIFFSAIISLFLLSVMGVNTTYGQTCNHEDKGNFLVNSKGCAPVEPEWEIRYAGLDPGVKVVVNWGDGTVESKNATGSTFNEKFTHTYPKDEGVCTYNVIAYVEANGVRCAETEQRQNITVWDTDNPAHGKLSIDPYVFRVCYGNEATLRFTDNSAWNCFNLNETSTLNEAPRWIQWEYGTGSSANRIPGVRVGGNTHSYPYLNGAPKYPVYSPGEISDEIFVPGNTTEADIGKVFEVTLRNWNQCNPYNNGVAPVVTTARIIIVDAPKPKFTIGRSGSSTSPTNDKFCPGERVYFRNTTSDGYQYNWKFTGPNGFLKTASGKNTNRNDFTDSGVYTAELTVTDNNAAGSCAATVSHTFEIIDSPVPDMEVSLDGDVITNFDFCERIGDEFDFSIKNETTFPVGAKVKYEWRLRKNGAGIKSINTADINELFEFSLVEPGPYTVSLTAIDNSTTCKNTREIEINIYNTPKANVDIISSQELCVGRDVAFKDRSGFVNPKGFADDAIVGWEWWFDYANNTNSQSTAQNPTYAFSAVGQYDVRLEVTTKYGCKDDTIFTITVNPIADAIITVDMDEGCAPFVPTFTNVKANDQNPGISVLRYKWIGFDENNDIIFEEDQFPEPTTNVFVDTFAHPFPYTRTDNQNQLYKVIMEAYSEDENGAEGCVTTSNEITLTVFPTASARFFSNYDPYGSNCTPVVVDFEVDAATKALPFAKTYEWVVSDETGEVFNSGQSTTETFSYTFTSVDSIAIKNYNVTLTAYATSGPCIQPYTQQIKINPTPSSKFTYTVTGQCEDVDINFNANQKGLRPQDYHWTFVEQGTGSPAIPENNPVLNDNFTLTFARDQYVDIVVDATLRTKNSFGCESTGPTQTFTIPKLEDFIVKLDTVSDYPKCAPFTVTFDNNSSVPSGTIFSLKVQKGSGAPIIVSATDIMGNLNSQFSYAFDEAGSYVVTLIGSNPVDGCTREDFINTTIHPPVEAIFDPSETVVCVDQQIDLNEKSYAPASAVIIERKWTISDISDLSNPIELIEAYGLSSYAFDAPGEYAIKLSIKSNNGCVDEEIKTITVLPKPEFTLNYSPTSCDQKFSFEVRVTDPSMTIAQVKWVWGDGSQPEITTDLENTHLYFNRNGFNNSDEYTGSVTATAATGCTFTETFTVKLLQDVSTSFLMNKDEGCAPLTVVFDDRSLGYVSAEQKWSYRELLPTEGSWIAFSGVDHTFINEDTQTKVYQVRLQSKSVDGCTDEMVKQITVDPQVIADFDIDYLADCSPMEVKFTNKAVRNGVEYIWDWSDGTDDDTTTVQADIVHVFENISFSNPRNFKVRLTATDINSGCSTFLEKTVTVQPSMQSVLAPAALEGCSPMEVFIDNSFNGISVHNWQVINTTTNQVVAEYSSSNPVYSKTLSNTTFDAITYQIIYTGSTASNSCSYKEPIEVLVYPEISASFTASPLTQELPNATVTLTNTTHPNPSYSYLWDFGNGTTSIERNPPAIVYDTYGKYTISLTVEDQYGECTQTVYQEVQINPTGPKIDFEYHPAEGCGPLTVQFISKAKYVEEGTLLWDFGDNSTSKSSEKNPTYTYYEPGEYTVTLQGSNAVGVTIKETKEYIINIYDNPRANFRIRQRMPVYTAEPVIFLNESVDAVSYLWDFGDGTTSTEFEPKHAYTTAGDYTITLIATSALGCTDTLVRQGEVEIEAQFEVKIPNVFTPNGDQDNDIFLPLMQGVVEYNLLIFNRWGELLFESKSQEVGWDGYYKGVMSPPDVYIYKLDLKFQNGERTSKQGDVTLLR